MPKRQWKNHWMLNNNYVKEDGLRLAPNMIYVLLLKVQKIVQAWLQSIQWQSCHYWSCCKKIIFLSERNLVCMIYNAIEKRRIASEEHVCSKIWKGPSIAMESNIIVEGMNYLEKVHNICCIKITGDGDTNLMTKIQKQVSFGKQVQKNECANQAVYRYFRALERLQKNCRKFSGLKGRSEMFETKNPKVSDGGKRSH